jgi:hypothetical protein
VPAGLRAAVVADARRAGCREAGGSKAHDNWQLLSKRKKPQHLPFYLAG